MIQVVCYEYEEKAALVQAQDQVNRVRHNRRSAVCSPLSIRRWVHALEHTSCSDFQPHHLVGVATVYGAWFDVLTVDFPGV